MLESAKKFTDENDVRCICNPYEADHQLVMLEKQGNIDGMMKEDSDIITLFRTTDGSNNFNAFFRKV